MKDLIIIKNVLPEPFWQDIYKLVAHENFPWLYNEEISLQTRTNPFSQNPAIIGSCGFSHTLCVEDQGTQYWPSIRPMLYLMAQRSGVSALSRPFSVYRAKANLQTQLNGSTPDNHNMPHIDPANLEKSGENWVFLYYLHDCDGDTFIFNEKSEDGIPEQLTLRKRVTPRANTGILFRDNLFHASSNPIQHRRRMNLNINLLVG